MRLTMEIKDENGKIIYQGLVREYNMSIARPVAQIHSPFGTLLEHISPATQTMTVTAIRMIPTKTEEKKTNYYGQEIKCDHQWKTYQGLMDSYEYCEKCGDKSES